jgi:hypothetical protein
MTTKMVTSNAAMLIPNVRQHIPHQGLLTVPSIDDAIIMLESATVPLAEFLGQDAVLSAGFLTFIRITAEAAGAEPKQ